MSGFGNTIVAVLALALVFTMVSQQALHAQAADNPQSINALLATADVAVGEKVSHKCTMCHTFNKGESDRIGPNLWNTIGNARAHSGSFNYSDELKNMHNEKWTYDALNLYITNPHKFAPGDKMSFPGIADQKERADLIAWMRTLSDNPVLLPAAK